MRAAKFGGYMVDASKPETTIAGDCTGFERAMKQFVHLQLFRMQGANPCRNDFYLIKPGKPLQTDDCQGKRIMPGVLWAVGEAVNARSS